MRALRIIVRNPMSLLGLILVGIVVLSALLAQWIAPYPDHNGAVVDFLNNNRAPSLKNLMGTDLVGRDILSRIMYGYQISLVLGRIVLAIATPIGPVFGLIAGYRGGWVEIVLMRIVDIFLSIPPLVLAIAMMARWADLFVNLKNSNSAERIVRVLSILFFTKLVFKSSYVYFSFKLLRCLISNILCSICFMFQ